MDLDTTVPEQVVALSKALRKLATSDQPGPDMWNEHFVVFLIERADFIDRYISPKLDKVYAGEKLPLKPHERTSSSKLALEEPLNTPPTHEQEVAEAPAFLRNGR